MKIFAATKNKNKVNEFNSLLNIQGFFVESAFNQCPEGFVVDEIGETFEENAILKAEILASKVNDIVFADDSGLEVMALNNKPGVFSARYGGRNATDTERMTKLLGELEVHPDRAARFVCVIAVASSKGILGTARGEVRGTISKELRGQNGFGYDPIFIPQGFNKTFGELSREQKNLLSHRLRAVNNAFESGIFSFGGKDRG